MCLSLFFKIGALMVFRVVIPGNYSMMRCGQALEKQADHGLVERRQIAGLPAGNPVDIPKPVAAKPSVARTATWKSVSWDILTFLFDCLHWFTVGIRRTANNRPQLAPFRSVLI